MSSSPIGSQRDIWRSWFWQAPQSPHQLGFLSNGFLISKVTNCFLQTERNIFNLSSAWLDSIVFLKHTKSVISKSLKCTSKDPHLVVGWSGRQTGVCAAWVYIQPHGYNGLDCVDVWAYFSTQGLSENINSEQEAMPSKHRLTPGSPSPSTCQASHQNSLLAIDSASTVSSPFDKCPQQRCRSV
jgi:hypothetical protein